jgi:ABC-type antimicrobial peptide transport system permease subunit
MNEDRVELLIAAVIGALLGIITGIVLGYGPAYTIYLGTHRRGRSWRVGLLASGFR